MADRHRQPAASAYTAEKQRRLRTALELHAAYCGAIERRKGWPRPQYVMIDATAGRGRDSDGQPGSPLILHEHARAVSAWADPHLILIDSDPGAVRSLRELFSCVAGVSVERGDFVDVVPRAALRSERWPRFGLIYVDTTGQALTREQWAAVSAARGFDLLLGLPANTIKRIRRAREAGEHVGDWPTMVEGMRGRAEWLIQPATRGRGALALGWVMLFGFGKAPRSWSRAGWMRCDGEAGARALREAVLTIDELRDARQGRLFPA